MRMFKPNPGELVDRQTILMLKLEHSTVLASPEVVGKDSKTGKSATHVRFIERTLADKSALNSKEHIFLDELELIRAHLIQHWIPDIANQEDRVAASDKYYEDLTAVTPPIS